MKKTRSKRLELKHTTILHLNHSLELDQRQMARANGGVQLATIEASMPECGTWCRTMTGPF